MSEFTATLGLNAQGAALITPTTEDTVNVVHVPDPTIGVTFSWSPQGSQYTYTAGATTYSPSGAFSPSIQVYKNTIISESSLVSYWQLDETSGTSAADSKGANTGTYTGGFTLVQPGALTNYRNTAVGLDGTTGYVSVAANASLRPAQVTVEAWVYPTALNPGSGIICSNTFSSLVGFEMGLDLPGATGTALGFGSFDGTWHIATDPGSTLPLNTWTYLVGTYDGVTIKLYRNGALVAQQPWAGPMQYNTAEFRIGRAHGNAGSPFWAGRIDEAAVYNTALTTQVANHFAQTGFTFTATATIPAQLSGVSITEYRWDFGDGVIGYGSPVTHAYQVANPQTQVSLRATDSRGKRWFCRKQLYLIP